MGQRAPELQPDAGLLHRLFLPPRQTDAGIALYVEAIGRLRDGLGVPVAVETGVNDPRARRDEMPDGEFMAASPTRADCGILLDLHNVYCNERNGRQNGGARCSPGCRSSACGSCTWPADSSWRAFGSTRTPARSRNRWRLLPRRDSGAAEPEGDRVRDLRVVPPRFGLDATRREVEKLRELWALRGTRAAGAACLGRLEWEPAGARGPSPAEWEHALGRVW